MAEERREHLRRFCPLAAQTGCDWYQVTSWYVGSPFKTEAADKALLEDEAALHIESHYGLKRTYFT